MNICSFLRKTKKQNEKIQRYQIPKEKLQDFIKLSHIFTEKKIKKISELNYQKKSELISEQDLMTLKSLEEKYQYPFYTKSIIQMDSIKKKLTGFRFFIDNDRYDIFTDENSYFIGQSSLPNHKVFTHTHEYQGNIQMSGQGIEFHILYETIANNILYEILGEDFQNKYTIDIVNEEYYLT